MYTLKDIASRFELSLNTLRYWLKKNDEDCKNEFYDFNLSKLTQKIKVFKKTKSQRNIARSYEQIIVLDLDEFKFEFDKYLKYTEAFRRKKRVGNLAWTASAIECYSNNLECEHCLNFEICRSVTTPNAVPPMKITVEKLLQEVGKPYIKF